MLTQERLKELFDYDPDTGLLTRRININYRAKIGDIITCLDHHGYIQLNIDGKVVKGHRIIWLYVYGELPDSVDHINGIRNDNRICNLRSVSHETNQQNMRTKKINNKTGFLGVNQHHSGSYEASLSVNGKKKHIGNYSTPEEAHQAYLEAKRIYHDGCTI